VQPEAILDHQVWLPPLSGQAHVAKTSELANASNKVRSKVEARLEALRVSALNQAFAGIH